MGEGESLGINHQPIHLLQNLLLNVLSFRRMKKAKVSRKELSTQMYDIKIVQRFNQMEFTIKRGGEEILSKYKNDFLKENMVESI